MKNLMFVFIALFMLGCGEKNGREKDAKEAADAIWQFTKVKALVDAGDKSATEDLAKAQLKLDLLDKKFDEKYGDNNKAMTALVEKYLLELTGGSPNSLNSEVDDSDKVEKTISSSQLGELVTQTKGILNRYYFTKATGLTSLISINFDDTHFTFRVVTVGAELCKASGTYFVSPASDGSLAKITLVLDGPIQKSPLYADNQGIDTELILLHNRELLLKPMSKDVATNMGMLDFAVDGENTPKFLLQGKDAFASNYIPTKAEKDSIDKQKVIEEEKKSELEEKLKGF